jgi:predicted dehydrogenase
MRNPISRRTFLASTAVAAAASTNLFSAPSTQPPKINVGLVGVGGRGYGNLWELSKSPNANIAALCDVDSTSLQTAAASFPSAKTFTDFRDLLHHPNLDAVLIGTADHTHAVITAAALRAGKHVYCEKPLCHTISELRAITALANETHLVTQLGVQNHAQPNVRHVIELIQSNVIGPVHDVHIWHNRVRKAFKTDEAPIPSSLNYDLWLGPAAMRPFRLGYHPYSWRNWWDFGNAELGDQSCHFLDIVFSALKLTHPTRIESIGTEPPKDDIVCDHIISTFNYPSRGDQPPVTLHWYDNPAKPQALPDWKLPPELASEGLMFIGDAGMLCTNFKHHLLLPEDKFAAKELPAPTNPKPPEHHQDWLNACLKNDPTAATSGFTHGALLTEASILGTLAYRAGKPLEWDPDSLKFTNFPESERFLGYTYRDGWKL